MRVVQYSTNDDCKTIQLGVRVGEEIVPLSTVIDENFVAPKSTLQLLQSEDDTILEKIKSLVENKATPRIPLSKVKLASPITNPDKVICIGMNYKDHCEEQNVPVPVEPVIFNKFPSSIAGPNDSIPFPEITEALDYEVELAFVIGKSGRNIDAADAMSYVFGYTVAHDVSARDWQLKKNGGQWLLGKTMDAFCPLGPELVTKDEVPDPHNLVIECRVNDEILQSSSTAQMVHQVGQIVAFASKFFTLLPGDVFLTGTPPGVGVFRVPPRYLQVGDVVECTVEGLGTIRNQIVRQKDN